MVTLKVLHKRFDEGSLRSFPDLVARQMVTLNRRESAKKKGCQFCCYSLVATWSVKPSYFSVAYLICYSNVPGVFLICRKNLARESRGIP